MMKAAVHTQFPRVATSTSQPSSSTASNPSSSTDSCTSTITSTTTSAISVVNTTPPATPLLPSFYWNPAMPQQQQQQQQMLILQQQTEETPKICNHSKRRHSDTASTSSSSPDMLLDRTDSTSSLDCQSLQRSLKRVRLSSSPGELRLQLDLRQLAQSKEWVQTAEDVWYCPRNKCRLEQCQADPLRLVFFLPTSSNCSRNASATRIWIQIPRMYPHRPPTITQIQHAASSVSLPFSNIQAIRISTEGPMGAVAPPGTNKNGTGNLCTLTARLDATQTVLTLSPWTCVLRLTDIMEFLYEKFGHHEETLWSTAPPMPEPAPDARGFLTPNRFDLGYYKGNTNAMDLKE